jgi:hypothetical protein
MDQPPPSAVDPALLLEADGPHQMAPTSPDADTVACVDCGVERSGAGSARRYRVPGASEWIRFRPPCK